MIQHVLNQPTTLSKVTLLAFFFPPLILGCELKCQNNGYCSPPSSQVTTAYPVDGTLIEICICPLGYAGLTCSERSDTMQTCHSNADSPVCVNGGTCTQIHRREEEEAWVCDCIVADDVSKFAGAMCRSPATEYCNVGDISFCTNGGSCRVNIVGRVEALDLDDEECQCPDEFTGPHCEFLRVLHNASQTSSAQIRGTENIPASPGTSLHLMLSITLISGAIIFATYIFIMIRKKVKTQSPLAKQGMEGVEFDTKFVVDENETMKDGDSLDDSEVWRDVVL